MIWFRAYYARVFPAGKAGAQSQLRRVLTLIAEHPEVGHRVEDFTSALEYPMTRTPFSVIYRIMDKEIEVLRVLDQRSGYANERQR